MDKLKKLERVAMLQILRFLLDEGESKWYQVRDGVNASPTAVNNSLVELGELGLLHERREPPQIRYISLSNKGKEVAQSIANIQKLLNASEGLKAVANTAS